MNATYLILLFVLTTSMGKSQWGVSVSLRDNEIGPAMFGIEPIDSSGHFSIQLNLLTFTVIPRDHYNKENTRLSLFPLYSTGAAATAALLFGGHEMGGGILPESPFLRGAIAIVLVPFILPNTQLHYNLGPNDSQHMVGLKQSIYAALQADTYSGDEATWWRVGPVLGVDVARVFGTTDSTGVSKPHNTIGVQLGGGEYWDVSSSFQPKSDWKMFVNFKVGWF